MNPKVSVIVASYNYQDLIKKTLDSLVTQTYKNLEIIVVDDGSRDNSVNVIKEYTKKYNNVFLYTHPHNENMGLSATIQEALKHCAGDWVAFCESDDFYTPDNIQQKIELLNKKPDLDVIVNALILDGGTIWDVRYINWTYSILRKHKKNLFSYFIPNVLIVTFSTVMMKKSVLLNCDFNTPVAPWLDFWLWRQVALDSRIGFVEQPLTVFLRHPESYIHREKAEKLEKNRPSFIKASDKLLKQKYGWKFLWRRYGQYLFGHMDTAEYKRFYFCGINIFTIRNIFAFTHIKYKYKLFGFLTIFTRKDSISFTDNVKWRNN